MHPPVRHPRAAAHRAHCRGPTLPVRQARERQCHLHGAAVLAAQCHVALGCRAAAGCLIGRRVRQVGVLREERRERLAEPGVPVPAEHALHAFIPAGQALLPVDEEEREPGHQREQVVGCGLRHSWLRRGHVGSIEGDRVRDGSALRRRSPASRRPAFLLAGRQSLALSSAPLAPARMVWPTTTPEQRRGTQGPAVSSTRAISPCGANRLLRKERVPTIAGRSSRCR
jgi:hypothetical protein